MPTQQRNKGRARVHYANASDYCGEETFIVSRHADPSDDRLWTHPILVLPATPEAVEEMRERVAKAICDHSRNWVGAWDNDTPDAPGKDGYRMDADAVLKAIGLSLHHRKGRKS